MGAHEGTYIYMYVYITLAWDESMNQKPFCSVYIYMYVYVYIPDLVSLH